MNTATETTNTTLTLEQAIALMKASSPVIFPTETFFGLGSRAFDPDASARVFRAKHRATVRPLPIILGDWNQLDLVAKVPDEVLPLLEQFWPGPLSVILPARLRVPEVLTGGTGRVALRLSSHPVAQALALGVGEPITASSANISGNAAVTRIDELDCELVQRVAGIVDGHPQPTGGLPSTLVEMNEECKLILRRAGAISTDTLKKAGFTLLEEPDMFC